MNTRESFTKFIIKATHLSKSDAQEIAASFHPIKFEEKEFILKEHEVSDTYLFLESGLMRTFLYNLEGEEITIDFFIEKNIVFEITSFFNRIPSEANIQAITPCTGYQISYKELNTLFHAKPAFRDFGRAILVKEFIASQKRNYGMINRTAKERYENLLITKPQIIKYSPLKYIASYLGITDSTLSRLRKNL